jgi:membrane protein DedA with SNARE-associated domain
MVGRTWVWWGTHQCMISNLVPWLSNIVYSLGYVGIALLILLGYLHLPILAEITLSLAGFLVGQGRLSFVPVLVWTTLASVAASVGLYLLGFWLGEEPVRRLVRKFGRFVFLYESDLDKAAEAFQQHGGKAVLIGRLIPGVTSFISVPAGIERMTIYGKFMIFTVVGTIAYNGAFIGLGWALGNQWELVERYASIVNYVVLMVIALGIIWFVWHRWKAHK